MINKIKLPPAKVVSVPLALGAAIILPFIFRNDFYIHVVIMVFLWAMVCLSLNIIFGYTGQLSLGHGALFGVGAYCCALLMKKCGFDFWVALPSGAVLSGIVGFAIGIPSLRLKGPYFAIVTLGFNVIITEIIDNWQVLTGGYMGIYGISKPSPIFGISFESKIACYFLVLTFLVLCLFFVHRLTTSLLGKNFIAIREHENLAESVGINTMKKKVLAFTLSAILAGLAGGLFASYIGVVVPDDSSYHTAFSALIYLVIGGTGTMGGVMLGPLIMASVAEILRAHGRVMFLINGIVLLLIIMFMPQGVWGRIRQIWQEKPLAKRKQRS